ncbi:hypothetical protein M5K25_020800 [Dendrobium thyrsiflorum]|uniref:Uncharacterized protein n=1 Tax=Dendrobium thyrsiflorum TaxID=117978 RepID=A0ABD0UHU6_DENTH
MVPYGCLLAMEVTLLTSRRKETLMALKVVTIIRIDGEAFETFIDSTLRVVDKAIVDADDDAIEAATTSVGGEMLNPAQISYEEYETMRDLILPLGRSTEFSI